MTRPFIIDAHTHLGTAGALVLAEQTVEHMLSVMDRSQVEIAVCSDHAAALAGGSTGIDRLRPAYESSGGRIRFLGVFDPRDARACLDELGRAVGHPGFAGLKLHPSSHGTPADSPCYRPAWEFARANGLSILTHSWTASDSNPAQVFSIPDRFESYIREFSSVRLVLGHAGGRGAGRHQAVRLACQYPSVHLDIAGDIYCYRLVEHLVQSVPAGRILFGSDWPWTGPADHLTRVLLAGIDDAEKARILRHNAAGVYSIGASPC
jgi:predicted TIM-barrel fold metal-dependent hydrolase